VAANDFRALPEDLTWFFVVSLLSETCAFLGDAARAAILYELLLPFARRHVVLSAAVCLGSASRYLGLSWGWGVSPGHRLRVGVLSTRSVIPPTGRHSTRTCSPVSAAAVR